MIILTPRQKQILSFIDDYLTMWGTPPTFREIGAEFGIVSPNGVECHLRALEKKGAIDRVRNQSRSIRVARKFRGLAVVDLEEIGEQKEAQN